MVKYVPWLINYRLQSDKWPTAQDRSPHTKASFDTGWPRHGTDTLTRRSMTWHDTEFIDTQNIDTPWHARFGTWHVKNLGPNSWKYFAPMFPLVEDMSKHLGPNSWKYFTPMSQLVEDMSEIYAHPLPRVYAIFLFAIEYSAKAQHTTTGAHAPGWILNGKQKSSIYSGQRTGIDFWQIFN